MKVPKYYLVKNEILALTGDLEPGTVIPTERVLADRFATSRTTVRQAISELVVDGRLERTQGRGTFVARPKLMQVRQLTSFSQDLAEEGWRPGSRILDVRDEQASGEVCRRLQVDPGTTVHVVERLRTQAEEPIALETARVPGPLPGLREELETRGSLYRTLAEAYDMEVEAVEDVVETALADPSTANLLGVETGLPLLLVHRTAWDPQGRVVEWTRSLFRGDRFRFVARQRLDDRDHPAAAAGG